MTTVLRCWSWLKKPGKKKPTSDPGGTCGRQEGQLDHLVAPGVGTHAGCTGCPRAQRGPDARLPAQRQSVVSCPNKCFRRWGKSDSQDIRPDPDLPCQPIKEMECPGCTLVCSSKEGYPRNRAGRGAPRGTAQPRHRGRS